MKQILVLTDFSSSAKNAALYAAALAEKFKAKIFLFHSFTVPLPSTDMPFAAISFQDLEEQNTKALIKEANEIKKKFKVKIEVFAKAGFVVDETMDLQKKLKSDLIITGMKGKTNAERILIGSTVTDLIRKTKTPVLMIPEKKKFHSPEKILLACDYTAPVLPETLASAKEFAKKFHSKIYLVNVVSNGNGKAELMDKAKASLKLERQFKDLDYVYYFPHKKDVIEGMDYFLERHKTDLIAMIPHKHNLFERMFGKSNTKRMIYHTQVPLLALPEKHKRFPAYLV